MDALCGAIGYSARPGSLRPDELAGPIDALFAVWEGALETDDPRGVVLARYVMGWTNVLAEDERGGALQERMARRALTWLQPQRDDLPHELAEAHAVLALCAQRRGERGEALEHGRAALQLQREHPPHDSWWATISRVRVARDLAALGWLEEAESILLAASEVITEQLGPQHAETIATRRQLAALYEALGRTEEARQYAPEPVVR